MKTLTKCVYGFETNPKKTPFGLLNSQVRVDNIIQNAGWFNAQGERLGQGDLTLKEMQHIAKNMPREEAFFVLTETDSGWDMPSSLDRTAPGFQYMLEKTVWAMLPSLKGGVILRIRDDIKEKEEVERDGVKFVRITRDSLQKAFTSPPKPVLKKAAEVDDQKKDKPADSAIKTPVKKKLYTGYKVLLKPAQTQASGPNVPFTPAGPTPPKTTPVAKPKITTKTIPSTPPIALPRLVPKKPKTVVSP